jgi:hypothetical protein
MKLAPVLAADDRAAAPAYPPLQLPSRPPQGKLRRLAATLTAAAALSFGGVATAEEARTAGAVVAPEPPVPVPGGIRPVQPPPHVRKPPEAPPPQVYVPAHVVKPPPLPLPVRMPGEAPAVVAPRRR